MRTKPRLAIICDYPEENWHSMDLCANMLIEYLQLEHSETLEVVKICPRFHPRLQNLPWLGQKKGAYNGDRLINRFWDYPQYLKGIVKDFDLFHIADHTYSQLAHVLPSDRTGIFCHDLDAFRSILDPAQEPRPRWYKAMTRRILTGFQKAAIAFHSTTEIQRQIASSGILSCPIFHNPYGFSAEFSPHNSESPISLPEAPFLLHVGSCIPRKRIDILLEVFAGARNANPNLKLVKVSGEWTSQQRSQIAQLDLEDSIIHLQGLERKAIAALYQRAAAVLMTSEAEGFGLPVIEALACGAIVICSDISVLKEVGGAAAIYCPLTDIAAWIDQVQNVITNPAIAPSLDIRLAHAQKYSWSNHADIVATAYLELYLKAKT
jgi:glycosyltransferase involved in cell wall biosynthesis